MKKYTFTDNGITYNNVLSNMYVGFAGPLTVFESYKVADDDNAEVQTITSHRDSDNIINAIDINWNEAVVGEQKTISTTTDLLTWIKEISASIDNIDIPTLPSLDEYATIAYIDNELIDKANVGDSYTKEESDEAYQPKGNYLTEHQDISGKANVGDSYTKAESDAKYLTTHQSLEGYATETYVSEKIGEVVGEAPETLDTLKEIADAIADNATLAQVTEAISTKANAADVYTKAEADAKYLTEHQSLESYATKIYVDDASNAIMGSLVNKAEVGDSYTKDESDAKYLTEHQSLEGYATESYVDEMVESIVGAAPENFDTLAEFADAMGDLKVIDVPAQEEIEGEHYTQEEIDAAQEGDEAYGKTVDDWKVEPVPAVEEESHNMTISEFVANATQAVDEKAEVAKVQTKYQALLTLLNLRDTDVNNVIINQELAESSTVTFEDGTVDNITVPETAKTTTVTAELDTNSTLNLTSPKSITINNTGTESTNLTVNAPAEGTTPSVTLKSGTYDTVTLQDASLTVSNNATVQNVVITSETTKSTTINAIFVDGATVTSNSEAPITVTNKNAEGEEVSVTLNAPGSTVTLSGGKWTTISGEVSENTLIINRNAKIQSINLTKGNIIVEVPRDEDIDEIINRENVTLGEGYSITHRTYEITNENSSKLGGVGEMILQEDITRTNSIVAPLAPAYNAVWNLNNHNITVTGTPKSGVYLNRYTSNLEVKGTGVIHTEGSYGLWNSATTGKIVVNDGVTIEAQTHVLYAEKGVIEVNGGSFKLTDAATADKDQNGNFKFLLNCYDANYKAGTANIIVKGGKFYGFNPAVTYGEPNGPVSYVAEGYESVPTNEAYEYGTVYEVRPISQ